jgi:hypothetical protein
MPCGDIMQRSHPYYSMLKFFVLDGLSNCVVAVSTDSAPDSALALSFFARPSGPEPTFPAKLRRHFESISQTDTRLARCKRPTFVR